MFSVSCNGSTKNTGTSGFVWKTLVTYRSKSKTLVVLSKMFAIFAAQPCTYIFRNIDSGITISNICYRYYIMTHISHIQSFSRVYYPKACCHAFHFHDFQEIDPSLISSSALVRAGRTPAARLVELPPTTSYLVVEGFPTVMAVIMSEQRAPLNTTTGRAGIALLADTTPAQSFAPLVYCD